MKTFVVTRKSDGEVVYRYQAEAPIEWAGMEFATHAHEEDAPAPTPAEPAELDEDWRIYVGPFFDRFGVHKLAILASADPLVQAVVKDASVRKYIALRERRPELLQVIGLLQSKGFAVDAAVLDARPTAEERYREAV